MRRLVSLLTAAAAVVCTTIPPSSAEPDPVGVWPLRPEPEVVAGFEQPSSPWGAGHRGVDLLGATGQRVRTALPGTVAFVGTIAGRGVVTVDHGSTRTTYEPVTPSLPTGTWVSAGGVIGRLAYAGSHCAPRSCLHWGWLRGDTYLDPLRLVGAGPVRLLPLDGLPSPLSVARPPLPTPYVDWRPLLDALGSWFD